MVAACSAMVKDFSAAVIPAFVQDPEQPVADGHHSNPAGHPHKPLTIVCRENLWHTQPILQDVGAECFECSECLSESHPWHA